MPNKSKTKGSNAERELCKIFTSIFERNFIRVPNSGAYQGGLNNYRAKFLSDNQKLIMSNDIIPPDEYPNVAIESKAYKEFEFHHFYREEGNKTLNGWITQVEESGIDMEKSFPMICFKPNRQGWFCCLWKDKLNGIAYDTLNYTQLKYNNEEFIIVDLLLFLNSFKEELKTKFSN